MTPNFGFNNQKRRYSYYPCTRYRHRGKGEDGCDMKPVPTGPLEDVVSARLIHLGNDHNLVASIVRNATSESVDLLKNIRQTRDNLSRQCKEIQRKLDALVESIADRRVGISSIGRKIIELEEQKEQLEGETLDIEIQIEDTQKKVVSAETLKNSLRTFKELYEKATPGEKKELVRLQIK